MTHPAQHEQKPTRTLPPTSYRGRVLVEAEAALAGAPSVFTRPDVVAACRQILQAVAAETHCAVPIYCFLPDRLHLLVQGVDAQADAWKMLRLLQQHAGFWFAQHGAGVRWENPFSQHLHAPDSDVHAAAARIADLPVREGLAACWRAYPHVGAIGYHLDALLDAGKNCG